MKSLIFSLLAVLACLHCGVQCAEHQINGKWYYFEDNPSYWNWHEAVDYCHGMGRGYELVSIETWEENDAIKNTIVQYYWGNNYWLGATDEADDDLWIWRNGNWVSIWDWIPREPSDNRGEDYLMLTSDNGYIGWQDTSRDNNYGQRALCEAY